MRLSRGWGRLLQFWVSVASLCSIGIVTLQMLGPPGKARPQMLYVDPAFSEFPQQVPSVSLVWELPEPVIAVAAATTLPTEGDTPSPEFLAPDKPASDTDDATQAKATPPAKKLRLRIVRDHQRCPTTACYKWRLIESRMKFPSGTTIDLARLRLAPGLREATEQGTVELVIEAIDQHKKINGRDTVIFIATDLTGVAPHEGVP